MVSAVGTGQRYDSRRAPWGGPDRQEPGPHPSTPPRSKKDRKKTSDFSLVYPLVQDHS